MKLSNIAVIFIVIALPVLLILGYYISLQIDTINMQTAYNTKLLESTKEAVEAFEINTVEWNEEHSNTADSKRRDVVASINTFTTSLANNLGVAGTSKDYMMSRIPAIAYTLYDGYYIYSPAATKSVIKNENGVAQYMSEKLATSTYENEDGTFKGNAIEGYSYSEQDKGKMLYEPAPGKAADGRYILENGKTKEFTLNIEDAKPETIHMLKPFMAYSEQVDSKNGEAIINYTLDNFVTVYGKDKDSGGNYIAKSGYLNKISNSSNEVNVIKIPENNFKAGGEANFEDDAGNLIPENNPIKNICFSGKEIKPEILKETIAYYDGSNYNTEEFIYVYEAEKDAKVYYDPSHNYNWEGTDYNGGFFRLDADLNRVYLEDLTEPLYKKLLIPVESSGAPSYIKVYQDLVDFNWYKQNKNGTYTMYEIGKNDTEWDDLLYQDSILKDATYDYSAINYCVESYYYTYWFNEQGFEYIDEDGNPTGEKIRINNHNDPELDDSPFTMHKREIIRSLLTENLEQAITNYSRTSRGEFTLPELKEYEWEQVTSNISVVTFLQNIPIGLKYYNNYAIASSTTNKEYVNTRELYFYNRDNNTIHETMYHAPYCEVYNTTPEDGSELIGYRSIDYLAKYYQDKSGTHYYFRHSNYDNEPVREACYYCIVQRALSNKYEIANEFKQPYYTTLARERYLQLESITIEQSDIVVNKKVNTLAVDYGGQVEYTITIENKGALNDTIHILDYWLEGTINTDINNWKFIRRKVDGIEEEDNSFKSSADKITVTDSDGNTYDAYWWGKHSTDAIPLDAGEQIIITYKGKVQAGIGAFIENTVEIRANNEDLRIISQGIAETQIKKKVIKTPTVALNPANVIIVLDRSASMNSSDRNGVEYATKRLNELLGENTNVDITMIAFAYSNTKLNDVSEYKGLSGITDGICTNYLGALTEAEKYLSDTKPNYIVFMSDGSPTAAQTGTTLQGFIKYLFGDSIFTTIMNWFGGTIENLISGVLTGWMECIWESYNTYKVEMFWSDQITGFIEGLATFFGADIEITPQYPDFLGVAKNVVWNPIMNKVGQLNSKAEIYSVYFNTGDTDSPTYGLKQIASGIDGIYTDEEGKIHNYYYSADKVDGEDGLVAQFEKIAKAILGDAEEAKEFITYVGEIDVDNVNAIKDIKVNGSSIGSSNVATIIDDIMNDPSCYDSTTKKGTLNLNKYSEIFHKPGDIEIIY